MIFLVLVALEVAAVVLAVRATSRDRSLLAKLRNSAISDAGCSFLGWLWNPRLVVKTVADSVRSPLCVVLLFALLDEIAIEAIHHALAGAPKPWRGVHRLLYHAETCLVIGWPAILAGAAWAVFYRCGSYVVGRSESLTTTTKIDTNYSKVSHPREKARDRQIGAEYLFGAWLTAAGSLAAVYPLPRGWTAPLLHAVELGFVAVALAAIPSGWRTRAITTRDGRAIGLLVVVELVVGILGAWGADVFRDWDRLARLPYAIGWAVLCVVLTRRDRVLGPTRNQSA